MMLLERLRDHLRARDEAKRRVSLLSPVEDDTLALGQLVWPVVCIIVVLIVGVFA